MPSPIRLYMPKSQIMIRFYREMGESSITFRDESLAAEKTGEWNLDAKPHEAS